MALRAALYVRVSPDYLRRQEEDSLERQEALCRAFCAARDWEVVALYRDAHTGTELMEREGLREARAAALGGDYDVLVTKCVDRLGREPVHQMIVVHELREAGVRVVFVQEDIPDTDEGAIMHHIIAYGAKKERQRILERTHTARRERATRYQMPLGTQRPPYGYAWLDARKSGFAPVEPAATAVRRAYTLALGGMPLRRIGITLAQEGHLTPSGKAANWSLATLRQTLRNPVYKGRYEALRWARTGGKRVERPVEERVPIPCEALVEEAVWEAVQRRLVENQEYARRRCQRPEQYLLRMLVYCGSCGYRMVSSYSGRPSSPVYVCGNRRGLRPGGHCPALTSIGATTADAAAQDYVRDLLREPEALQRELERLLGQDPTASDLAAVERTLGVLRGERDNLVASLAGLVPAAQAAVQVRLNAVSEQLAAAERERESVLGRRAVWEEGLQRLADLERWRETVGERLDAAGYAQWRELLLLLHTRVTVYPMAAEARLRIEVRLPVEGWQPRIVGSTGPSEARKLVIRAILLPLPTGLYSHNLPVIC